MGLQLDIYSHHFIVTGVDNFSYSVIELYAKRLVQMHVERDVYGNVVTRATYVYATRSYYDAHYRFHITLLDEFKNYLMDNKISIAKEIYHPLYTPAEADIQIKQGWKPHDNQVPVIDYLSSEGYKKVIDAQTGSGKALVNTTPVKTRDGWTNVEDLKVGDLVMGENGIYYNVTGVYPQGKRDVYKVTFKDGRTAVVDGEHLWGIHYRGRYHVHTTKYLLENNPIEGRHYGVPLVKHRDGNFSSAMFKPWLGDSYFWYQGNFIHKTKYREEALALQEFCWKHGSVCTIKEEHGYYIVDTGFYIHFNKCSRTDFKLDIISIEKLEHQEECTCISVDNPTKLFVIKDYIVTHNTIMTLFALSRIKQRVGIVIKPMYIDRWLDAIYGTDAALENVTYKDVVIVKGSKGLRSIFNMAKDGELDYKFIIISNRTLAQYYQHYKENGVDDYYANVKPEEMWELLGVGVRLIDESHQEFFSCFQCDLHANVPKSIELSGTLNPDDEFLKRMYQIMYPIELRMSAGAYTRYINMVGLTYGLREDPKPVSTRRRGKQYYSQAAYEESIFKQKVRLKRLQTMIAELVEELFIVQRLPEHKLLIFFDTINLCTEVAENLQKLYPDLKVSRYTQEEDSQILQTHDIIVATTMSASTAIDIPKLQTTISFVMRGSNQTLQQMVGRLRQLKSEEVKPTYYYLYTRDIPTHNVYAKKLQEVFMYKALSLSTRRVNYEI